MAPVTTRSDTQKKKASAHKGQAVAAKQQKHNVASSPVEMTIEHTHNNYDTKINAGSTNPSSRFQNSVKMTINSFLSPSNEPQLTAANLLLDEFHNADLTLASARPGYEDSVSATDNDHLFLAEHYLDKVADEMF